MDVRTLTADDIRAVQSERLRTLLDAVDGANAFYTRKLAEAGVDAGSIATPDDLRALPVTTKAELADDHAVHPPYGTNLTHPVDAYSRLHRTSGTTGRPMQWLDTPASWDAIMSSWADIYALVGLRPEDRLAFPFSFGPFIGFWAAFEGAARLGNLCIPGGGLSTEARLQLILDNEATFVCCTPTYALRMVEVAEQRGIDLPGSAMRGLIVAGEPGGNVPATRARIERGWGARVFDHWGMTELGPAAVESVEYTDGLYVLETDFIAEIVDPNTLDPVTPGERGELLITTLRRTGSPVIRYRTGDLVVADTDPSPDGLALLRLKGGILGRADDMITVRGNNVFPSGIEAVLREIDAIVEYRITVSTRRSMQHVRIEIEPTPDAVGSEDGEADLVRRITAAVRDRQHFTPEVELVPPESLPRFELKGRRFHRADD